MRYNLLPPISSINAETLTENSKEWYFIKRMAAIEALQSSIFKNIRNKHTVSDPGMIRVDEYDKASEWDIIRTNLINEFEIKAIKYKRRLGLSSMGFDTISLIT